LLSHQSIRHIDTSPPLDGRKTFLLLCAWW
jgi:hypothetical protein